LLKPNNAKTKLTLQEVTTKKNIVQYIRSGQRTLFYWTYKTFWYTQL